jgi:hypothetical protein
LTVWLNEEEWELLIEMAHEEFRDPQNQAGWLLGNVLREWQKNKQKPAQQ